MDNIKRSEDYKKNENLENIFPELEKILGVSEHSILDSFSSPKKPVFFIIGCARSGTTLLYQYLSYTNLFTYPTNVISRFYYAPYIGARIQQLLFDYDYSNEISESSSKNDFISNLGKSKGAYAPHEFWYFWNRFFEFRDVQLLPSDKLNDVNWGLLNKELHALESTNKKPLLMKALNLNWHLKDLKKNIPNCHFIYIKRNLLYNAQSLLTSRKKFYGNYNEWYSFKSPNYHDCLDLNPEGQVVEQVLANNNVISDQLQQMNEMDYTEINYEAFCSNPNLLFQSLNEKFNIGTIPSEYQSLSFENTDFCKLPKALFDSLKNYINIYSY